MSPTRALRYLSAALAPKIDEELMSAAGGFSLDQLMELAGLAVAQTVAKCYDVKTYNRVLVCCGPGNQGGDGLVAARHLSNELYVADEEPGAKALLYQVCGVTRPLYSFPSDKDFYKRLQTQCSNLTIPSLPTNFKTPPEITSSQYDVILDAFFGFSFHPPVRAPFDTLIPLLIKSRLPIISVDIPSGWDVEKGPVELTRKDENGKETALEGEAKWLEPDVLISLTAPKMGVKSFKGRHFLGGRFIPPALDEKLELGLPEYPGSDQIIELPPAESEADASQKL